MAVPLGRAAETLTGLHAHGPARAKPLVSVERRIYDIGSILGAAGIIARGQTEDVGGQRRQPVFLWVGLAAFRAKWGQPRPPRRTATPRGGRGAGIPAAMPRADSAGALPALARHDARGHGLGTPRSARGPSG